MLTADPLLPARRRPGLWRATVAAVVVAAVAACSSAPHPVAARAGAADGGRTIHLRAGQVLEVTLHTGEKWSVPTSSDPYVLAADSAGSDPTTGDATATFTAVGPGSATVASDRRCLPRPGRVCAMYIAAWSITVTVG